MRDWKNGIIGWSKGNKAYISVVFSWLKDRADIWAEHLVDRGFEVQIGGPAYPGTDLNQEIVVKHNPLATFTTYGCPNKCPFCIVPKLEGDFRERKNWTPRPTVCDNNILASSKKHFTKVVDSLVSLHGIDFNQGLDARLLTQFHIDELKRLDLKYFRFSWDSTSDEKKIMRAIQMIRKAGFKKLRMRVYVLIGYKDKPDDALYRLNTLKNIGIMPFPMRYQPINTVKKNSHVSSGWTNKELIRYMRYWANLIITRPIPFEEFEYPRKEQKWTQKMSQE